MSTSFWQSLLRLTADGSRLCLDDENGNSDFPTALGAGNTAPGHSRPQAFSGTTSRAQFSSASIVRPRTPALQLVRLQPKGRNTPGVETKPGKAVMGIPITAEEKRPWLLLHHGYALSQHGWVKPVRFSMVRCPKRLRVKLRTPNRRKEKAFSPQFAPSNRCFLPQPTTERKIHQQGREALRNL